MAKLGSILKQLIIIYCSVINISPRKVLFERNKHMFKVTFVASSSLIVNLLYSPSSYVYGCLVKCWITNKCWCKRKSQRMLLKYGFKSLESGALCFGNCTIMHIPSGLIGTSVNSPDNRESG